MSKVKFYKNKRDYFIQSNLEIDPSKLDGVEIIDDQEEAEQQFRAINGLDDEDGVYIPELLVDNGVLCGTTLNDCQFEIEDETAEEYINNYDL
jgi:hypothetical protein